MDFTLSEEQAAVAEAASAVFGGGLEGDALWRALAAANLLGIAVAEDVGGSGLGMVEAALLLEAQGRVLAPVPLWPTLVAAMALDRFGDGAARARWLPGVVSGHTRLAVALDEGGPVLYAGQADGILVGRELVAPEGVEPVETTSGEPAGRLARVQGGLDPWVERRVAVALSALQVGVCAEALRRTAAYVSEREQFGRPIGSFQGVALRAADAYIDVEAMRVTCLQAAWRLDAGLDAAAEVRVAKWWAAEAGHRVVHTAQHLHGGIGSDVDYPIHRYFLWGKQLTLMLGGASAQIAALADLVV